MKERFMALWKSWRFLLLGFCILYGSQGVVEKLFPIEHSPTLHSTAIILCNFVAVLCFFYQTRQDAASAKSQEKAPKQKFLHIAAVIAACIGVVIATVLLINPELLP